MARLNKPEKVNSRRIQALVQVKARVQFLLKQLASLKAAQTKLGKQKVAQHVQEKIHALKSVKERIKALNDQINLEVSDHTKLSLKEKLEDALLKKFKLESVVNTLPEDEYNHIYLTLSEGNENAAQAKLEIAQLEQQTLETRIASFNSFSL